MKESTKLIIIKSMINTVVTWLLFAMILSVINYVALGQSLIEIHTIILAILTGLSSYVGFLRKELNETSHIS